MRKELGISEPTLMSLNLHQELFAEMPPINKNEGDNSKESDKSSETYENDGKRDVASMGFSPIV